MNDSCPPCSPCCRPRRPVYCYAIAMAAVLGVAFAFVGLAILSAKIADNHAKTDVRLTRAAHRAIELTAAAAELGGRIDSAEKHIAESLRYAHEKRTALADELRKETSKAVGEVRSELERRVLLWGQHINAERKARREEIQEAGSMAIGVALGAYEEQQAATKKLLARIAELEKNACKCRHETPKAPAPAAPVYEWRQVGCELLYGYQDGDVFRYTHVRGR